MSTLFEAANLLCGLIEPTADVLLKMKTMERDVDGLVPDDLSAMLVEMAMARIAELEKKATADREYMDAAEKRIAELEAELAALKAQVRELDEYSSTTWVGECQHQWVTYNGTAPYRQCSRCMKYESLPVTT
jgi:uncharacterized coiled-coil protein SlyX